MVARRLVIRGRVQGVGYRYAMTEVAAACGAAGWVRNRSDGTVEAFVQGESAVVGAVIAWCRRGPSLAQVAAVDVTPAATDPAITAFRHTASL
jgi:acylphosphatase